MTAEIEGVGRLEINGCPLSLMVPVVLGCGCFDPWSLRHDITSLRFNLLRVIEADCSGPLLARYALDLTYAKAFANLRARE